MRALIIACAPLLNYAAHFLRTLSGIISNADPNNSLVVVPANTLQIEHLKGNSEKALLVVIFTADGGEILRFTSYSDANGMITDTKSLRNALKAANCNDIMQQLSMPWVMGVMELMYFEIVRTTQTYNP